MRVAVLSSHTKSLFWFRLDMMKEFVEKGHEVIAVGPDSKDEWEDKFAKYNIEYKQIHVDRTGLNPFADLKTLLDLFNFIKVEKPDKIFTYQAKTIVYGCIAAKLNKRIETYPLVAGLGSIFRGKGIKNKIIKEIMKYQYKVACSFSEKVFFQNIDDKSEFILNGIVKDEKTEILNGSGVDLTKFMPTELPSEKAFLFIGRLIKDKGIIEYLEACKIIKNKYPQVRCLLVGPFDRNPTSLSKAELDTYINNDIVEYFGEQDDVRPYISQSNVFVLPSYHEGTPKTILEAMAMGRAIITTDAPGCRATVENGKNGFLIKVKDVNDLVHAMERLIVEDGLIYKQAKEGIQIAKEKYDVRKVNKKIIEVMNL